MSDEILFYTADQIAVITFNRPQALNALNWAAQEQFAEAVTAVAANPSVRVLVLTGTGDRAFTAGGDLKELSGHPDRAGGERLNRIMSGALAQMTGLPVPVIAAVNGNAYGGGCEILTACDVRVAADHCRFSFAQIRNALTSGWGGTARLVRQIGQSRAMELMLTARAIDAAEAQAIGLVHHVVPKAELETAVADLAQRLIALPRRALAANKRLIRFAAGHDVAAANRRESQLFVDLWTEPDHIEALDAFVAKRPPVFNQESGA